MRTELWHYGTPRHSGRYPWGSGDNPYQRDSGFLSAVHEMQARGMTQVQIAKSMGMNTTRLREQISRAKSEKRSYEVAEAIRLKEKGMSTSAIARRMGRNESSVRSLLDIQIEERNKATRKNADLLKKAVAENGYIDVGGGVEQHLGITANKLKNAVSLLKEEGYSVEDIRIEQMGTGKLTTVHVLAAPGTSQKEIWQNRDKITLPFGYSDDGGNTARPIEEPRSVDSSRIDIRYADQVGPDGHSGLERDGLIELRRGVEDISLGKAAYAQVRIAVDGTHYLKGMAVYSDDLPDGVDIRFNTNKTSDVPKMDVLKEMKPDPANRFGATIRDDDKLTLAQRHYIDKDGNEQLSALNIVNEEGNWSDWGKTLSSQFLSKQSPALAKQQLQLKEGVAKDELKDIMELTNPVVKTKLLDEFASKCDADAAHLSAAALPRQNTKVILPVPSLKDNEIYAPGYQDGETVCLVRFPHAGIFEIPKLTVNNRQKEAKGMIGDAIDAVGVNHKTAEQLSGADFDGDTVLVIPADKVNIKTSNPLPGLVGFDPKDGRYKAYDGMHKMTDREKGIQMGMVSNLITDMTIKGASASELERAVRHSMVVIDAKKHHLNYKLSEQIENIDELRRKYQMNEETGKYGGASTLISRAESQADVPDRREKPVSRMTEKELADYRAGKIIYEDTGKTKKSGTKQSDGTYKDTIVDRTTKTNKMNEVDDAYKLASGTPENRTRIESVYADYANSMKALANQARAAARTTPDPDYSPSASKAYATEVSRLKAALDKARMNAPLERQAQLIANKNAAARIHDNPDLDAEHKKRIRSEELTAARKRVGSGKKTIYISDREWEAINRGAVSKSRLREILDNADPDRVRQLATPRSSSGMSSAKIARAKTMLNKGYTQAEVANMLDVSVSTLVKSVGAAGFKGE